MYKNNPHADLTGEMYDEMAKISMVLVTSFRSEDVFALFFGQ